MQTRLVATRRFWFTASASLLCVLIGARVFGDASPESLDRYPTGTVTVQGKHPDRTFKVWLAANDARREQGLMFVRALDPKQGMYFQFEQADWLTFWMKNTLIPLDILYVASNGRVVNIAQNATPMSLQAIPSTAPAIGVLEIGGGLSKSLGLQAGDRVLLKLDR